MNSQFNPGCLPILIGSLPVTDHEEAVRLILAHTPEIPLWPQLPKLPKEGMVRQFLTGFPGLQEDDNRCWIDTSSDSFEEEMVAFYEDYMRVEEEPESLENSRFSLGKDTARGFFTFLDALSHHSFLALKGQVTGPVTTGSGITDQDGRSIFYDDNLRDMLVKLLALKGRWQVEQFRKHSSGIPPIVFIDEPAIVSFGSSGFMGISKEMVSDSVDEVIAGIQGGGGLAGIHICANGDWGPPLLSNADIISFDAYFYFENFILFREQLTGFLNRGGILAWGIVPTGNSQVLEEITGDQLFDKWRQQLRVLADFGLSEKQLAQQTLIAPSCGTGSLSPNLAEKVLRLTGEVSKMARKEYSRAVSR